MRALVLAAALGASGCLNLDFFVFSARPARPGEDRFARSTVPPRLREYRDDLESRDDVKVTVYVAGHDGQEGDVGDPRRNRIGLLYCHGQSSWIGNVHGRVEALWRLGYTVAVFDPRGYGETKGTPTEVGVAADVDVARAWFEQRMGGADNVGLYGRSLGTALCLGSAATRSPRALALESTIGALQDFVNDSLAVDAPSEWLFDSVMDNNVNVQKHTGALLVMHGTADDFVQPKYSQKVFDLSDGHASPRALWLVEGATHSNVPCRDVSRPDDNDCVDGYNPEYVDRVTGLFDAALGR
ncbi:MAG: alpha/beta fold hydrolase [Myxococcaceae bacterium]|jgi:fermentation-respiration switch protein FrsA (DUF1100 family)|nr:alpha/beta fold hydrolase [Myxococcaceae bacterium]MCA3016149.1 alpha/beta fold hydrolase [Myxococcaceae bacterium]